MQIPTSTTVNPVKLTYTTRRVYVMPWLVLPLIFSLHNTIASDTEDFVQAETHFQQLRKLRARNPDAVSTADYRTAAEAYIESAGRYYDNNLRAKDNTTQDNVKFDEGGVWFPDSEPMASQYHTYGTKWGAGSPYTGGPGVPGPRIPGGTVTYSYMPNGVSHSVEHPDPGPNVHISGLHGYDPCFLTEIDTAFAAWEAVADIQFEKVEDSGDDSNAPGAAGDIRIGAHSFSSMNILAHAFFPPPNGASIAGDLHLNKDQTWSCTPAIGVYDIGITVLHEIGHSIGLRHEPIPAEGGQPALMNPVYNPSLTGLLTDDLQGIISIYGKQPVLLAQNITVLQQDKDVLLRWDDFDQQVNGYNIWRFIKDEARSYTELTKVNNEPIVGDEEQHYQYTDTSLNRSGITFTYVLEQIHDNGQSVYLLDDKVSITYQP